MIRRTRKRFQLPSETLRWLRSPALQHVVGGNLPETTLVTNDGCDGREIVPLTGRCKLPGP